MLGSNHLSYLTKGSPAHCFSESHKHADSFALTFQEQRSLRCPHNSKVVTCFSLYITKRK